MKRSVLFIAALGMVAACGSTPDELALPGPAATRGAGSGAAAANTAERDCFSVRSVSGFTTVDQDTVRIDVGPRTSYEVDAGGATCANLRWANQIALESEPTSSMLCVGDSLYTARIRTDQGDECLVSAIRRIPEPTPAS